MVSGLILLDALKNVNKGTKNFLSGYEYLTVSKRPFFTIRIEKLIMRCIFSCIVTSVCVILNNEIQ